MQFARVLTGAGLLAAFLLTTPTAAPADPGAGRAATSAHQSAISADPAATGAPLAAARVNLAVTGANLAATGADPAATGAALTVLRGSVHVAGTAWWIDPATGGVVVSADATVTRADLDRLAAMVSRIGARLIREPGTLSRRIAGGDPFFATGVAFRCTIGFNVRGGATFYFLTSAHCVGAIGSTVYADPSGSTVLGVVAARDAGHDYALVRYTNLTIAKPSAVNLYNGSLQPITSVSAGFVGQTATRAGSATGLHVGAITGLNATVNYVDGQVTGLIRTNVCAEPGDSGGPLFAATTALGMTSGGSGNCSTGGTTFFSSAARAMTQYGVTVY